MRPWAVLLVVGVLIATGCRQREETGTTDEPTPAERVEISDVSLGRAIGPDKAITDRTDTFAPGDTIYVSIRTEGIAPSVTLAARWTYEDGQLVDESSQTIAPDGPEVTEFHISKPDAWPTGSYQVQVSLDGQPVETKSFTVEAGS